MVEIVDHGNGIPAEVQGRIFEPFFTTKGVGKGTGLGLDIVQRIVRNHKGSVSLDSKPGRTVFRIRPTEINCLLAGVTRVHTACNTDVGSAFDDSPSVREKSQVIFRQAEAQSEIVHTDFAQGTQPHSQFI